VRPRYTWNGIHMIVDGIMVLDAPPDIDIFIILCSFVNGNFVDALEAQDHKPAILVPGGC
jgi:hypothetical protein